MTVTDSEGKQYKVLAYFTDGENSEFTVIENEMERKGKKYSHTFTANIPPRMYAIHCFDREHAMKHFNEHINGITIA